MTISPTLIFVRTSAFRLAAIGMALAVLAACSSFSGPDTTPLPAGLSARMDMQGARLDRVQALALVNAYRTSNGRQGLAADMALDAQAQALANEYALSGTAPSTPDGVIALKLSAGYSTFADTFSGWRNSSQDAATLVNPTARRAGIAVAYNQGSAFGTHWVLVLDD